MGKDNIKLPSWGRIKVKFGVDIDLECAYPIENSRTPGDDRLRALKLQLDRAFP